MSANPKEKDCPKDFPPALRRWFPRLGYGEVAVEPAFIERSLSAAE